MPIEDSGFETLLDVFSQKAQEQLLEVLNSTPLKRSRAGIRHLLHDSRVMRFANCEPLVRCARNILGKRAAPFRATLFDKSPDSNWLVTWHQDTVLPLRERRETPGWGPWSEKDGIQYAHAPAEALEQVLALRIQIDDCVASNGVLRVIPGSHKSGVLSDAEIHEAVATSQSIDCVARAGSVVVMRPLLIHASSKSQTDARRRVLHIEYAAVRQFADGLELAVA